MEYDEIEILCSALSISWFIQEAAPHLKKGSSVVLISSLAAYNPPPAMAMYGVTKTAVLGLTKVSTWLGFAPFPSKSRKCF